MRQILKELIQDPLSGPQCDDFDQKLLRWVAAVSDRVKNPVAAVVGATALLEKILDDENRSPEDLATAKSAITAIRTRLFTLNSYVDELQELTQHLQVSWNPFDWAALVSDVKQHIKQSLGDTSFLQTSSPSLTVWGDYQKIKSSLIAVITNSFEAVPITREPAVCLDIRIIDSHSHCLTIDDNGEGFDDRSATMALNPFYSTKSLGAGLGLTLTKHYIQAHSGQVAIGSSTRWPGGAQVTLSWPIKKVFAKDTEHNESKRT